jgi:hypothetical protein
MPTPRCEIAVPRDSCAVHSVIAQPSEPTQRSNKHRILWKTVTQHPTERVLSISSEGIGSCFTSNLDAVTGTWSHAVSLTSSTEISRTELRYILDLEDTDVRRAATTVGSVVDGPGHVIRAPARRKRALSEGAVKHEERAKRTRMDWDPYGKSSHPAHRA